MLRCRDGVRSVPLLENLQDVGGEVHREVWWGNLREICHLEDLGVDGRIILNSISKNLDRENGLD